MNIRRRYRGKRVIWHWFRWSRLLICLRLLKLVGAFHGGLTVFLFVNILSLNLLRWLCFIGFQSHILIKSNFRISFWSFPHNLLITVRLMKIRHLLSRMGKSHLCLFRFCWLVFLSWWLRWMNKWIRRWASYFRLVAFIVWFGFWFERMMNHWRPAHIHRASPQLNWSLTRSWLGVDWCLRGLSFNFGSENFLLFLLDKLL